MESYSKRILLNMPRIQDSRFKVQGKVLPGTLNHESEAYSTEYVVNTVEYGTVRFDHCISSFESLFRRFVLYRYYRYHAVIAET